MKERDYGFDNSKLILIILVVFAHLLEISTKNYGAKCDIYRVIYSFHMPAFVFLTGYFAKFNKRTIVTSFLLYFAFQFAYLLFSNELIHEPANYQFSTPYWLLWYLLAYVFYLMLTPLLEFKEYNKKTYIVITIIFISSLITSLFLSFDKTIGYYLTLERFITFLPFFIAGFYTKRLLKNQKIKDFFNKNYIKIPVKISFILFSIGCVFIILLNKNINANMLYGSYPYPSVKGYSPSIKLLLFFVASVWIVTLFYSLRFNKKIIVLTRVGKNTLPIFLFHGFFVRTFRANKYLVTNQFHFTIILLIAIGIVIVLGNIIVEYIFDYIFRAKIVDLFIMKIKDKKNNKELENNDTIE